MLLEKIYLERGITCLASLPGKCYQIKNRWQHMHRELRFFSYTYNGLILNLKVTTCVTTLAVWQRWAMYRRCAVRLSPSSHQRFKRL